ncbi:MAG: aldehyde ferredoxin oxidoreductase N-terminal domain-containing protein [Nitrososphaeria archaeon]|jgi:aldehyde:ferredoxin oxidoreductase
MYGWMGKVLRIDLSSGDISEISTGDYVPDFIGGYGLALKLIWDETVGKQFPSEFDPEAPLVLATGPLAGTPSPAAGRSEVGGLAPQSYPVAWVADSGFGGDFATKLKFSGYDAILIVGSSNTPKYIYVEDGEAEIIDATYLWGLYTIKAEQLLLQKHGLDSAVASIGPAGENLVRIAIITTKTENASGQGGFGAVMGSKKLKAIVVKGNQRIRVAEPDILIDEVKKITAEFRNGTPKGTYMWRPLSETDPTYTVKKHSGCTGCGECMSATDSFPDYYENVQQHWTGTGMISGDMHCIGRNASNLIGNIQNDTAFEFNKLAEYLGINHWELFAGMGYFIQNCYKDGKLSELMGEKLNLNTNPWTVGFPPELAAKFINAIAYRDGDGDIFAEGSPRAEEKLGIQNEAWKTHKHGYGPHWDGRYLHLINYPLWVIAALLWSTWGRDPNNSTHCCVESYYDGVKEWGGGPIPYEQLKVIGEKVYGTEDAFTGWKNDADLGYKDKEIVVIYHQHRSMMKTSLTVCDWMFPMTWSTATPDNVGDYEAEVRLFNAVTGQNYTLDDMLNSAERCMNVLRSLHVRQGRTRTDDESVIRYFTEQKSAHPDEIQTLDQAKFGTLLDNYYERRGWDKATGWPTEDKLVSLGLKDVSDELARTGNLP